MRGLGDKPRFDILAMARGKSPWGGGKQAGETIEDETPSAAESQDGEAEAKEAEAKKPSNNPWLPSDSDGEQRRSARIDDLLRQRRGSGGGGLPPLPGGDKARVILPWVLAGTALALALTTSLHVLEEGQSGSVSTLGRYSRSIGPGLNVTLPWPVETVSLHGGGSGGVDLPGGEGENLLLTRDGELIDIAFKLRWQVSDPRRFSRAFVDPDATIRSLAAAEVRAGVAELTFDEISNGQRQSELQQRVGGRVQRAFDALGAGVKIDGIEITRARAPARLSETAKRIAGVRQESDRLRKQAEDWANETRASARAEASDFNKVYEQYRLAPEVIRKRMYYETMERVLRNNGHIVVGGDAAQARTPKPSQSGAGGQ